MALSGRVAPDRAIRKTQANREQRFPERQNLVGEFSRLVQYPKKPKTRRRRVE